jgi:hypothetical protein
MRTRLLYIHVALIAVAVNGGGCENLQASAKAKPIPTLPVSARPANTNGLSAEQISQGARLCVAKCVRCHPLYDPNFYNDTQWSTWMTKMSRKAHLKAAQEQLLREYLGAFRRPE